MELAPFDEVLRRISAARSWKEVLGFKTIQVLNVERVERRKRLLLRRFHPVPWRATLYIYHLLFANIYNFKIISAATTEDKLSPAEAEAARTAAAFQKVQDAAEEAIKTLSNRFPDPWADPWAVP